MQYRKTPGPADYNNVVSSFQRPHGSEAFVSFTTQPTHRQQFEIDPLLLHTLHVPGPGTYTNNYNSMLYHYSNKNSNMIGKSARNGKGIY